jgi:hypothetical protein
MSAARPARRKAGPKLRAAGFALGSVIGIALALGLDRLMGSLHNGTVNLAVIPAAALAGGLLAGASLGLGPRGILGFAIAYAVALPVLLIALIGVQGLSGGGGLLLLPAIPGALSYAVMGALGVGIAGLGSREALRSAVEFGCAGLGGSLVFALFLSVGLILPGSIAFLVLPAAVGAFLLLRRLEERRLSASADTP